MILTRQIQPRPFRGEALRAELNRELEKIGKAIKKDYDSTTKTWEGVRPAFEVQRTITSGRYRLYIGPRGEGGKGRQKWLWVSEGTKAHLIVPKATTRGRRGKKSLAFPGTFSAKTSPGVIGSKAGGSSGAMVFAKIVHHPGTKARKFDRVIRKKWANEVAKRMRAAMRRGADKSGHGRR